VLLVLAALAFAAVIGLCSWLFLYTAICPKPTSYQNLRLKLMDTSQRMLALLALRSLSRSTELANHFKTR
jgi:hypothetical protein